LEKLGISLGLLVSQLVNFGLLAAILYLLLYKPLLKVLQERRERIQRSMADIDAARESAARAQQEYDRKIAEAQRKAQDIIAQAAQSSEQVGAEIEAEARRKAEEMRRKAHEEATEEKARLLADAQSQIASLSMLATERILGMGLDEQTQHQLIDQFLADLGKAKP